MQIALHRGARVRLASEDVALNGDLVSVALDADERTRDVVSIPRNRAIRQDARGAAARRIAFPPDHATILGLGHDAVERVALDPTMTFAAQEWSDAGQAHPDHARYVCAHFTVRPSAHRYLRYSGAAPDVR